MIELPIQPGHAVVIQPERLESVRSGCGFSGLLLDCQGRLSLSVGGEGVRATFAEPAQMLDLAVLLFRVAQHLIGSGEAAAAEAGEQLARIVATHSLERNLDGR